MTQAEFNRYWNTFFGSSTVGDPGNVNVGGGSASFTIGDQKYVGISQSVAPGNYLLSLSISGSLTSTRHFVVYSGANKLYSFTSPGDYSIPLSIPNGDIQLIYSSSNSTNLSDLGILYYIKLEAPQTSYTDTVYTIYGTISRARSDGKEAYNGEIGGTQFQITTGDQFPNPYLEFKNTYSSSNPGFNFSRLYYSQDAVGCGGAKRWEYITQQITYPTTVKIFYNGDNTQLYYKLDTSSPNYNNLGSGTYSTTSPTARSFTLLNSGDTLSIEAFQYLSFACSASSYIDTLNSNGGVSIREFINPNISLYTFPSIVYTFNSCA